MNREERFEQLLNLSIDGDLSAAEQEELDRLVASDPELRLRAEEEQRLAALLRGLPRSAAPAGLLAGALEKGRQDDAGSDARIVEMEPSPRPSRALLYLGGIAAALLIGVFAYTTLKSGGEETQVAMTFEKEKIDRNIAGPLEERSLATSIESAPEEKERFEAPEFANLDYSPTEGTTSLGDVYRLEAPRTFEPSSELPPVITADSAVPARETTPAMKVEEQVAYFSDDAGQNPLGAFVLSMEAQGGTALYNLPAHKKEVHWDTRAGLAAADHRKGEEVQPLFSSLFFTPEPEARVTKRLAPSAIEFLGAFMQFDFPDADTARMAVGKFPDAVPLTSGTLQLKRARIIPLEEGARLQIPLDPMTPTP